MPPSEARQSSAFRLGQQAVPHLPLRVRSTGRYDVAAGWSEPPVRKWFVELTWTLSGEGEVLTGEQQYLRLKPGDIHVYFPGETHHLRALGGPGARWRYHWITFDHPDAERWLGGFNLARHTTAFGPCPEPLFKAVAHALRRGTAEAERQAARHAHDILLAASATSPADTPEGALA
ncbi:MAG: AraC family ligand binding domain-containing protein, partial [Verrucomicrobiota bacterium]